MLRSITGSLLVTVLFAAVVALFLPFLGTVLLSIVTLTSPNIFSFSAKLGMAYGCDLEEFEDEFWEEPG